ncbi:MSC_0882 family membrane protein [Spiroplasma endosymbiont of Nebria brevicollis]|uniref:MSC_0882 family membrane protein n=1 Tax=Spiroplasma endosymbiont of Nebria brevicollis TaxID=3066284 RepID=UPI00313D260F
MSKLKSKLFSKLFIQKENLSSTDKHDKLPNANPYFSNVVPPSINNNIDTPDVNNFSESKHLQVTSSYIMPLQEKSENIESFSTPKSTYYEPPHLFNTMALVSFKNNFKIPKPISREIKSEKLKQLLLLLISFASLVVTSTFIGLFFGDTSKSKYIPHPVLMIPLSIICAAIVLINIIEFLTLRREVDLYIERTLKGSLLPPNFIIRNYRKIHTNLIILNWVCISSYICLGIAIGIMFLISGQKLTFIVQSWTVQVPKLTQDAVTLTIVLCVIFTIHVINFVLFKFRKRNIISYYGYEIINPQELNEYKKKINRICMWIVIGFATLILFAIIIPIIVVKRRKRRA